MSIDTQHPDTWSRQDAGGRYGGYHLMFAAPVSREHQWPRVAAFEWARHQMLNVNQALEEQRLATPSLHSQQRLTAILRSVLADTSVFPSIAYDAADDLLIAEWRAGARSIEIEVSGEGEALYTVKYGINRPVYEGVSDTQLRRHLRDLSAAVALVNPGWRSLFTDRRG